MVATGMILVHKSKVAEYYHRWYIDYGYRKVASWRDALYSLFKIHNETMNIWSHLIGLICVVIAAANLSYDFYDSAYSSFSELLAVESYFISAAICMLLSTLFHWFGCVNESCYEVLLRLDLTGVALLVTGSYVPAVYYGFQCVPSLQQFYSVYAGMVLLVGLAAPWLPVNPTIRPYVLASTVAGGLVPAAHWVLITPAVYRDSLLPVRPYYSDLGSVRHFIR